MAQKIIFTRKKANKYRNRRTEAFGHKFDSAKEADRYGQLLILQRNGLIENLETQVKFCIEINGVKICDYIADFRYVQDGVTVVEDVKGMKTKEYRLKNKLMKAVHKIIIKET